MRPPPLPKTPGAPNPELPMCCPLSPGADPSGDHLPPSEKTEPGVVGVVARGSEAIVGQDRVGS